MILSPCLAAIAKVLLRVEKGRNKMGWKCGCVFVGSIDDGYFSTKPQQKPELALSIYRILRGAPEKPGIPHHFDFWPKEGHLVIGAYEKGAFIADQDFGDLLERGENDLFEKLSALYETKDYLALALHSVVNYAAFTYCKNGTIKRSFACSADDGIIYEAGSKLPEELKQYENSFERDGETIFPYTINGETEELTIDCIAEEIVFDLMSRPLGSRLDEACDDILLTEIFAPIVKGGLSSKSVVKPVEVQKPFWKFW